MCIFLPFIVSAICLLNSMDSRADFTRTVNAIENHQNMTQGEGSICSYPQYPHSVLYKEQDVLLPGHFLLDVYGSGSVRFIVGSSDELYSQTAYFDTGEKWQEIEFGNDWDTSVKQSEQPYYYIFIDGPICLDNLRSR